MSESWSHGKGDASRITDSQKYRENYDLIKFPKKKDKKDARKQKGFCVWKEPFGKCLKFFDAE